MGMWRSHPWCEAIIAGSLSSCPPFHYLHPTSLNPSTPRVASRLPSIIPSSLVRKLGRHSAALPPSLYPSPSFLFLTHYSQFTGWYMKGDTGPIQSHIPINHSACWSGRRLPSAGKPPSSGSPLCSLHFTPPLPLAATQNFPFPLLSFLFPFTCLFFFFSLPLHFKSFCCAVILIHLKNFRSCVCEITDELQEQTAHSLYLDSFVG